ncbi:MAG: hypothetical protein HYR55_03675 [Acidobacteria bacterium]|nr:hypothetical protein [Acidobacteriota bacterium]MBI3658680.1 hypothetical protein [Acidobacteriota bacterium]
MSQRVEINFGPYFELLSAPEQRAAVKFIEELAGINPEIAARSTVGPGNDGAIYVYATLPTDEDQEQALS